MEIRQRLEEAREELLTLEHQIEEERLQKEEAWKEILKWKMVRRRLLGQSHISKLLTIIFF